MEVCQSFMVPCLQAVEYQEIGVQQIHSVKYEFDASVCITMEMVCGLWPILLLLTAAVSWLDQ